MANHSFCDGITRRDMLQVGTLGTIGLSLGGLLRQRASVAQTPRSTQAESAIVVWLGVVRRTWIHLTGSPTRRPKCVANSTR